jgi:hypothetical protein
VESSPEEATMSAKNVCVLAGVLLATGALLSCSGEADEPVPDPIEGTWLTSNVYLTFDGGDYEVTMDPATDTPFEVGTYEVDGTALTLTPAPPTADMETTGLTCSVGQVGVYEMTVSDDGSQIQLKVVSDDCTMRRDDFAVHSLKKAGDEAAGPSVPASNEAAGPSVPASNAAVFDFTTDSLCTWFTADDMNEIVAVAQQRAGTAYPFQAFNSVVAESPACDPESGWRTPERITPETPPGHALAFTLARGSDFSPLDGGPPRDVNPDAFRGHSLLDDEVSYQLHRYQYAWSESVWGYLRVDGHKDETLYFRLAVTDDHEISKMRALGAHTLMGLSMAMADETLERMNWINATK